jgi:drug/metabolite transporter (DMT)-like permease
MTTELWAIGLVLASTLLGSFGPIFLKRASGAMHLNFKSLTNPNFIAGLFFYAIGTAMFIPALKGGELSVLYPLVATIYIWVSFLSIWMLNEKMNKFKWLAVVLIIIGIAFIGIGS